MTAEALSSRENLGNNQFYMWRAVIAIAHAHADHNLRPEERAYLEKTLSTLAEHYTVSAEQKKIFAGDMETAQNVYDLMRNINDPECRSSVIQFGQVLVWSGGHPDSEEEAILDKLTHDQMSSLDVEKLRVEINGNISGSRQQNIEELKQLHAKAQKSNPLFNVLDKTLLSMDIDMLD